jgi:hypothetical protein
MGEGSEAIVYLLPYQIMETQFVQRSVFTLLGKKTEISGKTVLEILRKTETAISEWWKVQIVKEVKKLCVDIA